MTSVTCSSCGRKTSVPDEMKDQPIPCSECGARLVASSVAVTARPPNANGPDGEDDLWQGPEKGLRLEARARQTVMTPAAVLLAAGALGAALQAVLGLASMVIGVATLGDQKWDFEDWFEEGGFLVPVQMLHALAGIIGGLVIVLGARRMARLEGYSLVVLSCLLAMVPVLSPCCLLGIPAGVWALIVVSRPEVKAAFR